MDDPSQRLEAARRLLDDGELVAAEETLQPLTAHPDPAVAGEAWLLTGTARYRRDDEAAALAAWRAAAETDGPAAWIGWRSVAEQQVRDGELSTAIESYREAERRAPREERGAIANRLGWLLKETGHDFAARRQFNRARAAYGSYLPVVSYTIMAICILVFVADAALAPAGLGGGAGGGAGGGIFGGGGPLVALGAVSGPQVAAGEWYRVVTAGFLHLGVVHLLFNMYALYLFGPLVERMYGHLEFLAIYLLAIVGGSVLTLLLQPVPGAAGASGGIFGLFGLVFVAARWHRVVATGQSRALMGQIGSLLVLNLVFTFLVPFISWTGHLGGLIVGGTLGFLLPPTGAATLGSFWRTAQGTRLHRDLPAALRVAAYVGVAAVLLAGGYYAVAVG